METKKINTIIALALISGFLFINAKCNKSPFDCANTVYNFEAHAKVLNPKDSINVGDTIWLEIVAPITQIDILSSNAVSFKNAANLGTAIGFGELLDVNGPVFAAHEFNYVLKKGKDLNSSVVGVKEYRFIETANAYEFQLGIIPKRKGYFNFGLSNAANVFRSDDKCTKASYKIYFKSTPLHLYLITQALGAIPDSSFSSPYCFKVI